MRRSVFGQNPKAAVVATVLVLALGGWGFAVAEKSPGGNPPATVKTAEPAEPNRLGFAPVVKRVMPAVVSVNSTKIVKTSAQNQQVDPLFRQFFGDNSGGQFNVPDEQRSDGLGSGVIVSPEGYILTNNHVVDGATNVTVTLSDKRELKARVVGTDPRTDIAVIKIDASNLPTITVGNSDNVQVGDYALAIGNPFGVGQTVTMGIVSATHRGLNQTIENQEDFIQTDAPINPGNSGGALVNDRGELIGINTAIIAHGSAGNQGIGFAVPVNLARNVMDQLIKSGKVTRAYLGIYPQDVTPSIAKLFGKKTPGGALVADVTANTPASRAGIEKGDIVLDVNGNPVTDANQLRNTISSMAPDAHVNLKVLRNGSDRDIAVTLGELPTEEAQANRGSNRGGSDSSEEVLSGVTVEDQNGQSARKGVVVTKVRPNSAAADAGLQPGDVIQEVNRQPVRNVADFRRAVHSSNDGTLMLVNREGRTAYIAIS
jgi:serine protease Do